MRLTKICTLLLIFALSACGTQKSVETPDEVVETPDEAVEKTTDVDPWAQLQESGDVAKAEAIFRGYRDGERKSEGIVGLMMVHKIRVEHDDLRALLGELEDDQLDSDLVVSAADAAIDLRPVPARAIELGMRACEIAENSDDDNLAYRAQDTCAMAIAAKSVGGELDRCKAGCEDSQTQPLFFAGTAPVVLASINGSEPTPFIVDTGASATVITKEFAEANGISAVPETSFKVNSPGGLLNTGIAITTVESAGLVIENTPTMVLELPIGNIGGIISPQSTWRNQAIEFDLRDLALITSPSANAAGLARLPLRMTERTPYMLLDIDGFPRTPMILDTGAVQTVFFTSYEERGDARFNRVQETRVEGAGGKGAQSWATDAMLEAKAGELEWTVERPVLSNRVGDEYHQEVRYYGMVGMDLMMGRRVVLDPQSRALFMSPEQRLAPWRSGAKTVYEVTLPDRAETIRMTEEVAERDEDTVTLEVTYEIDGNVTKFAYVLADTWASRGTWLIARPAQKMWDITDEGEKEIPSEEQVNRWEPVFEGFQTVPTATPKMNFIKSEVDGEKVSCTEIEVPAKSAKGDSTLELVECPTLPWRTQRLTLRGPDKKVIYQFEQVAD